MTGAPEVTTPLKVRVTGELREQDLADLEKALVQHYRRSIRATVSAARANPTAFDDEQLESPYAVERKIREAKYHVHRLEVALRLGDPIPPERWRAAIGAMRMAQRYLEQLVGSGGRARVDASIRALERAASLMAQGGTAPVAEVRARAHRLVAAVDELLAPTADAPAKKPAAPPLKQGWHLIVDESGRRLGYVEVATASLTRWYDADLEYVDAIETPIESEGLGPLEYLAVGAVAGRVATKLVGGLAVRLARSFVAQAARRAAVAGAIMTGVAEAAPVIGGQIAEHAFILSEALAADVAVLEARVAGPRIVAAAEAEAAGASSAGKAGAGTVGGARAGGAVIRPAQAAATASTVPRYATSLGEQAEADVLRRYHPNALSVPAKFRAYDAYEGGTVKSFLRRERSGRGWVLVVNQVVSDARWISLKRILDRKDVTPENVAKHVDAALRAMERDAGDRSGRQPSRDPEPVDENTYWRVIKENPRRVTLQITFEGEVPSELARELENAGRDAALKSGRLGDLPPFDLMINGKDVPLARP